MEDSIAKQALEEGRGLECMGVPSQPTSVLEERLSLPQWGPGHP